MDTPVGTVVDGPTAAVVQHGPERLPPHVGTMWNAPPKTRSRRRREADRCPVTHPREFALAAMS